MSQGYVYEIYDETHSYIGFTLRLPLARFGQHLSVAGEHSGKHVDRPFYKWLRRKLQASKLPKFRVLKSNATTDDEKRFIREMEPSRCLNIEHTKNAKIKTRGAKHGMAKLRDRDVQEMRIALSHGESKAAIASRYGCTESNIRLIESGKSWKSLPYLQPGPREIVVWTFCDSRSIDPGSLEVVQC